MSGIGGRIPFHTEDPFHRFWKGHYQRLGWTLNLDFEDGVLTLVATVDTARSKAAADLDITLEYSSGGAGKQVQFIMGEIDSYSPDNSPSSFPESKETDVKSSLGSTRSLASNPLCFLVSLVSMSETPDSTPEPSDGS